MGFFNKIFGKDKSDDKKVININTSGNKNIRFKEDLIDILVEDHNTLFKIYADMLEKIEKKDYETVYELLKDFKTNLEMHVYIENIQLYTYIKNYFQSEKEQLKMIENIQNDMDGIVLAVSDFAENWIASGINESNSEEFINGLKDIGNVLTKRTKMEENRLYILYQN